MVHQICWLPKTNILTLLQYTLHSHKFFLFRRFMQTFTEMLVLMYQISFNRSHNKMPTYDENVYLKCLQNRHLIDLVQCILEFDSGRYSLFVDSCTYVYVRTCNQQKWDSFRPADLMSMTSHLIPTNSLGFRRFFNIFKMRVECLLVAFLFRRRLHVCAKNISSLCKHVLPYTHTHAYYTANEWQTRKFAFFLGNSCHVCASNNFSSVHEPHHFGFPPVRSNVYIYIYKHNIKCIHKTVLCT